MVVFYGCRREKEELLYKEEWEMYKREGVLTALVGAFQFDKPHYPPKMVFVADRMAEQPDLISTNLLEKGGYFFMCGPAGHSERGSGAEDSCRVAVATPSVQKALKAAVRAIASVLKCGKAGAPKSEAEADKWFKDFMDAGRVQRRGKAIWALAPLFFPISSKDKEL
ncbi:unnamed protein product [Polarella glacialis]|uniref:NADPH--hemoprotein reductase n=1 Tax=Polarella glacialis TaxID=89957 RepID=A0A813JTP6_POLGL|nr:unnamed protein product [Polarella glacialis]